MNIYDKNTRRGFLAKTLSAAAALTLGNLVKAQGKTKWNDAMQATINYEIAISDGRYQRPYTSVWIEDTSGQLIRTLNMYVNTSGKGMRYMEHLTRWVRDVFAIYTSSQTATQYLLSVSSPTREPGKFSVVWDGKDDKKAAVDQGDYYVCVESTREHGPYALVRQKVTFAGDAISKKFSGEGDIKEVSLEYGKKK